MKKFVLGFLIGAFMFSGAAFAAVELNVVPNPFPVLINGTETPVEGYNINGSTFLKLADFKKAGLTIKFNETDKQIEITSNQVSSTVETVKEDKTMSGTASNETDTLTMPSEKLPEGMEWFYYKNDKYTDWAIKYNNDIYVYELVLSNYGFSTTALINNSGIVEEYVSAKNNSNQILYNKKDLSQVIRVNDGYYINIIWLERTLTK